MAAIVAIKPPYGLIFATPAAYLAARRGLGAALRAGEYWLAASRSSSSTPRSSPGAFPAYGRDVLPAVIAAYLPVRETALELVANAATVGWAALAMALALIAGRGGLTRPLVAVPALAALAALVGLFHSRQGLALSGLSGAGADRRWRSARRLIDAARPLRRSRACRRDRPGGRARRRCCCRFRPSPARFSSR